MNLFFRKYGSGKPLIIIHGLFGSSDNWIPFGKKFSENGFEVFAIDLRNHGRSPHSEEFSYSIMKEDLKKFLDKNNIKNQKRNIDNLIKVRASLAAKAEEIALLRVSMENVSRSGTVLLYKAQADPIKVGPRRTRTVLIAMAFALIGYSLVLIVNTLVREGGE